jgi:metacaspase-1
MKRRAVLIGINRYQIPGADLRGCVNDVENVEAMLRGHFEFPQSGIRKVTDGRATTARIRREVTRLVESLKPGDVGLLHYSGHGSNIPDTNGDEADQRDEILCPSDLDWYSPDLPTDDWLREQLDGLADGAHLTVIFDCCHSGTATRAIPRPDEPRSRYLPHPYDLMATESGRALRGTMRGSAERASRALPVPTPSDISVADISEVLLTGCRADQESADAKIGQSFEGAMSHSLVQAVTAAKGRLTYRELHERMVDWLAGEYTQVPQLEGRAEHLDLGVLQPY